MVTTLSALLALSLAGCSADIGTSANSESGTSGENAGGKTKIIYWTPDRHDADFMKSKIDEFNQTNKDNIEVEMTVMGDNYPQAVDIARRAYNPNLMIFPRNS